MTPWKVAVGLTAAAGGVGVWVLWGAVSYLHEYTQLVMDVHGAYLLAYGTAALLTVGAGVYQAARAVSLGSVGRKVDVVERAIRRGAGRAASLQRRWRETRRGATGHERGAGAGADCSRRDSRGVRSRL